MLIRRRPGRSARSQPSVRPGLRSSGSCCHGWREPRRRLSEWPLLAPGRGLQAFRNVLLHGLPGLGQPFPHFRRLVLQGLLESARRLLPGGFHGPPPCVGNPGRVPVHSSLAPRLDTRPPLPVLPAGAAASCQQDGQAAGSGSNNVSPSQGDDPRPTRSLQACAGRVPARGLNCSGTWR